MLAVPALLALAFKEERAGVYVYQDRSAFLVASDIPYCRVEHGTLYQVTHALVLVYVLLFKLRHGMYVPLQRVPRHVELLGDAAQRGESAQLSYDLLVIRFREDFGRAVFPLVPAHLRVSFAGLSSDLLFGFCGRHFSFLHSVLHRLAFSSG